MLITYIDIMYSIFVVLSLHIIYIEVRIGDVIIMSIKVPRDMYIVLYSNSILNKIQFNLIIWL